jgi:transcription antitermination protein NusB
MSKDNGQFSPRIIVIQKLYGYFINKDSIITFPKHRYKKFIKDIVNGTIEREELIENLIETKLKEHINTNKTEMLVKLILKAAIYEFMYMHKIPIKVVISEYLKVSEYFIEESSKSFLNAILDKASKISRTINE